MDVEADHPDGPKMEFDHHNEDMMIMAMTLTMKMLKLTIQMGPRWRARMTITAVFQWPREAKT